MSEHYGEGRFAMDYPETGIDVSPFQSTTMKPRSKSGEEEHSAEPETTNEMWDRLPGNAVFRTKIDARLSAAEGREGETPHEEVFAELRRKYRG